MTEAREIEMCVIGRLHCKVMELYRCAVEDRNMLGLSEAKALKLDGFISGVGAVDTVIQDFAEKCFGSYDYDNHPAWRGETML